MQDKKIYEFSWCSYKDGFKAQDLNNELISYLGFLKNLKELKYLNNFTDVQKVYKLKKHLSTGG